MNQNGKLVSLLNQILAEELRTINKNALFESTENDMKNDELVDKINIEAANDIKQAEWLTKRIIFLEVLKTYPNSLSQIEENSKINLKQKSSFSH